MADDHINGQEFIEGENEKETETDQDDSACESFHSGQLSYIGHDIDSIPQKLIDDYSKVTRRLDLSFNQIKCVKGLEEFCHLEELVLDNNTVSDIREFPTLEKLHTLTLNKNQISDLEHLLADIREKFPRLAYLSLLGNPACPNQLSAHDKDEEDYLRYRNYVLYCLPTLKFLDSSPVRAADLEEARRVGPYMTVRRGADEVNQGDEAPSSPSPYSPLSMAARGADEHQGTFGKSRYIYYGKHSEGNRFIRNNDL